MITVMTAFRLISRVEFVTISCKVLAKREYGIHDLLASAAAAPVP